MDSQLKSICEIIHDDIYNYKTNENSITDIIFFDEAIKIEETFENFFNRNDNNFLCKFRKNKNKIENENLVSIEREKPKALILTEQKLFQKFQKYIEQISEILNLNVFIYFIEEGDFFKQAYEVNKVHEYLLDNNFEKTSLIVGLGGGKITDLAGYIASTYFRGINSILIPTNLLAMVDASIGGKTGINHYNYGKNVIGTISQPNW